MHLYVHEPLMRAGVPSAEIGEEMEGHGRASCCRSRRRCMSYVHDRLLSHFIEQDLIGHMEADLGDGRLGRRAACGSRSRSRTSPATRA